ncbi:glyoxalase [Polaribacter porphyrae]|uniref:Glyoxalase n=1 Tax=Polaribacter porphyrae TaxID=1137780 RepID=A0A2S7WKC4_9FLAO|nr:glyoxalase [Polaribacter porphyrae]PQJ78050.1 glyoxalase [Polaribacter porphyrae]
MTKNRPTLENLINANTTEVEIFQNSVLRPIIKMQHDLIIAFFESYLKKRKIVFTSLSEEKKKNIIKSSMEKDISFKNKIIGSVLGHFSMDEYQNYTQNSSEFNRRIKQIIIKRLQDSI